MMTFYGTNAKIIGVGEYDKYINDNYRRQHTIFAKSDIDIDIKIILQEYGAYEYFGNDENFFVTYGSVKIENNTNVKIKDSDEDNDQSDEDSDFPINIRKITHIPINELYLDLKSIMCCNNEYKCDIFEVSHFGNDRKIDDYITRPEGFYKFNKDLFKQF